MDERSWRDRESERQIESAVKVEENGKKLGRKAKGGLSERDGSETER